MPTQWFYRFFDKEFGPVPFETIGELVRNGHLSPGDKVREGECRPWVEAGSIVGLFHAAEELLDPSKRDRDQVHTRRRPIRSAEISDSCKDLDERSARTAAAGTCSKNVLASAKHTLFETPQSTEPAADDDWYFQLAGKVVGPIAFSKLALLVEAGRLSTGNMVRCGADGEWVRAEQIEGLYANGWYLQASGGAVGPMPLSDLVLLAETGKLSTDDFVRRGVDGEWVSAERIDRLYAGMIVGKPDQQRAPHRSADRPAPPDQSDFELSDSVTALSLPEPPPSPESTTAPAPSSPARFERHEEPSESDRPASGFRPDAGRDLPNTDIRAGKRVKSAPARAATGLRKPKHVTSHRAPISKHVASPSTAASGEPSVVSNKAGSMGTATVTSSAKPAGSVRKTTAVAKRVTRRTPRTRSFGSESFNEWYGKLTESSGRGIAVGVLLALGGLLATYYLFYDAHAQPQNSLNEATPKEKTAAPSDPSYVTWGGRPWGTDTNGDQPVRPARGRLVQEE